MGNFTENVEIQFLSYGINNIFFESLAFGKNNLAEGLNVCIKYEFNLLDHVGAIGPSQTG